MTFLFEYLACNPSTWVGIGFGGLTGGLSGALAGAGQLSLAAGVTFGGVTVGQITLSHSNSSYDLSVSSGPYSQDIGSWEKKNTEVYRLNNRPWYTKGVSGSYDLGSLEALEAWDPRIYKEGPMFTFGRNDQIYHLGFNSNIAAAVIGYDINGGLIYNNREGFSLYFEYGYSQGIMYNTYSLNAGVYTNGSNESRFLYDDIRGYGGSRNYAMSILGYSEGISSRNQDSFQWPAYQGNNQSSYSYKGYSFGDPRYIAKAPPFGFSQSQTKLLIW